MIGYWTRESKEANSLVVPRGWPRRVKEFASVTEFPGNDSMREVLSECQSIEGDDVIGDRFQV